MNKKTKNTSKYPWNLIRDCKHFYGSILKDKNYYNLNINVYEKNSDNK